MSTDSIYSELGIILSFMSQLADGQAVLDQTIKSANYFVGLQLSTAENTLSNLIKSEDAAILAAIQGIQNNALGGLGDILKSIGNAIAKALESIGSVLGKLLLEIDKLLKPIEDLLKRVEALTSAVEKDYQAITTLIDELKTDLHSGIAGLLKIPTALSDAVTSVETNTMQALQALGVINKKLLTDVLIPGMSDAIGNPLKAIGANLSYPTHTDFDLLKGLNEESLGTCGVGASYSEKLARIQKALTTPATSLDYAAKALTDVGWLFLYLESAVVADVECVKQGARQSNPSELLGIGDVIEAYYRQIISDSDAKNEVERRGLSKSRFDILVENAQWLPGLREAFLLFWRGEIKQDELNAVLKRRHLTQTDIDAMQAMLPEPVEPREVIEVHNRQAAAQTGFLTDSLNSEVPADILQHYLPKGKSENQALYDWLIHWKIPDPDWFLTAYVRGLLSEDDYKNAAIAHNYPPEILDKLLPIYQETVQGWMIPEMMPLNLMPADEWRSYLHYVGFGERDAELMIKWGQAKGGAALSQQAQDLAAISISNAEKMYIDGIIEKPTLIEILETHKYTQQAAVLQVDLIDQEQAITARKNWLDGIIAEADAGLLTPQQVSDKMYAEHYSEAQVIEALNKIHIKAVGNTKHLTKAEVLDMLRYNVISGDTAIQQLISMGYSASDALALYDLEVAQHGEPAQPATTGSTGS